MIKIQKISFLLLSTLIVLLLNTQQQQLKDYSDLKLELEEIEKCDEHCLQYHPDCDSECIKTIQAQKHTKQISECRKINAIIQDDPVMNHVSVPEIAQGYWECGQALYQKFKGQEFYGEFYNCERFCLKNNLEQISHGFEADGITESEDFDSEDFEWLPENSEQEEEFKQYKKDQKKRQIVQIYDVRKCQKSCNDKLEIANICDKNCQNNYDNLVQNNERCSLIYPVYEQFKRKDFVEFEFVKELAACQKEVQQSIPSQNPEFDLSYCFKECITDLMSDEQEEEVQQKSSSQDGDL